MTGRITVAVDYPISPVGAPSISRLGWWHQFSDRPHLDASDPCWRNLRGRLDGFVPIVGVYQIEPRDALLRFGKRSIGDGHLAVPDSHGLRGLHRLKRLCGVKL